MTLLAAGPFVASAADGAVSPTNSAAAIDPIAALAAQMSSGQERLRFDGPAKGYLPDLLARLGAPEDSQVLVFSRTSLQQGFISPTTPRAIFFTDKLSIGYIPGAPLIEMWAVGEDGAMRFYTLKNTGPDAPRVQLEGDQCNLCHASLNPLAPGPMMESVTTASTGNVVRLDRMTDGRTPIGKRWGGWYVTGRHGDMRHLGNVTTDVDRPLANEAGQNLTSLQGRFDARRYSRSTSDIVALMTLEHETGFLNLAGAVQALSSVGAAPEAVDIATGELADYMLGIDGASLTAPVTGVSGFSERFAAEGPKDPAGRSLRQFDLRTRLFRYPVSYMIYTPAFDGLPSAVKAKLYRRLADVLTGQDHSEKYQHMPASDRQAAFEIIAATKPNLPPYWRSR